jgi:hypothetical protein
MLLSEIIVVYCEKRKKQLHTFCEQNAKFVNAKAGGMYIYHCVLKSSEETVSRPTTAG